MKNNSSDPKTGFNVGYDFAFYRLSKPDSLSPDVIDGYYHKADAGGTTRKADLFIKKWLSLRLHAFERGVHFSEELNVTVIKKIHEESAGVCPITKEAMTAGTLKGTDWSIDRVINSFGYVPSNIIVMSRRANEAKGSLSLPEVKEIRDSKGLKNGLNHPQWCRLFDIMWHFEQRHEGWDSNCQDELMGLREGYDLREFGLALLDQTTHPDFDVDDLPTKLLMFECCHLPSKKHKLVRKEIFGLMKKRENCADDINLCALMKRSSSTNRKVISILNVLNFEAAHKKYMDFKTGTTASIREAKEVIRVNKNIQLSFSQRGN